MEEIFIKAVTGAMILFALGYALCSLEGSVSPEWTLHENE